MIPATHQRKGKDLLSRFIRCRYFESWQESRLGNDLFITDQDRASRIHDAAEHGCDGSTHAEIIQDWRDAWSDYLRDRRGNYTPLIDRAISLAVDDVETFHERQGTLHQQIG